MQTNDPQKKGICHYLRILKAIVVLATLLSSAAAILIFSAPPAFFVLRLCSVHRSRTIIAYIFGCWLSMWPFFFEKINKTRVVFSGHKVPQAERAIVLCNHRTEVDWMYIWSLALRKKRLGCIKYVVKSSVRNLPIFGWAFFVLEFLLIDRRWKADEHVFDAMLSTFKSVQDPLWLVIFPEGTDYTEEKCLESQKFAEENGLPKLHHVLLPRTKGVQACLEHLHDSVSAVYDLTVAYSNGCPLFVEKALGTNPKEVHIHVKRIPISDVPLAENEVGKWLVKEYARKDELLTHFYREGVFPDSGDFEEELSMVTGLANFFLVMGATYALLSLLFSSFLWVRYYFTLSCVLLSASTYLNYKPSSLWKGQSIRPFVK